MSQIEDEEPIIEAAEDTEGAESKKKSPVKTVIFSAAGAIVIGAAATAGGYFLFPGESTCAAGAAHTDIHAGAAKPAPAPAPDVTYVNVDPLVVTLGENARSRYLKISISLETVEKDEPALADLKPRIRDTLNTYLRAVDEEDLVEPAAMARLRSQMLRRLRLVAPGVEISDVLITDFILN